MAKKQSAGCIIPLIGIIICAMLVKYWYVLVGGGLVALAIWIIVLISKNWNETTISKQSEKVPVPQKKPNPPIPMVSTQQPIIDNDPTKMNARCALCNATGLHSIIKVTDKTIDCHCVKCGGNFFIFKSEINKITANYQPSTSPKNSPYVPPYRTDATIFGASAQPAHPDSVWIPQGRTVEKDGYTIHGGLIYFGSGLRNFGGWGPEPALIDPSLPIDKSNPDRVGSNMTYWPTYNQLHPTSRAAYLEWLSTGKNDPTAYIGYVFLYFYGLERRVLADIKDSALSHWDSVVGGVLRKTNDIDTTKLASAQAELDSIVSEAKRLLSIYGKNGSFGGYCSRFIDIIEASREKERLYKKPPTYIPPGNEIPFSINVALGQMAVDGMLLPAEWAYAWVESDPMSYLRTPAKRCREELQKLFCLKYSEKFGEGCKLKQNKTKLKFFYRPASSTFGGQLDVPLSNLPDVTVLKEPITKLRELAQICTNELDAFSRYMGRKNSTRDSIEAITLLPAALIERHEGKEYLNLSSWLNEQSISEQPVKVQFSQLLQLVPSICRDSFGKREATSLSLVLSRMGVGIEPDVRFGNLSPKAGESVVLFKISETSPNSPSPEYTAATVLMHLASAVAGAGGSVAPEEELHLEEHIEAWLFLLADEKIRLKAHTQWLLTSFPGINGIKKRMEELKQEQKESIARFLVSVAHADGYIDPTEIKILTKIYTLLGLDAQNLYSHVHTAAVEPVTVQIAGVARQGYSIPVPPRKPSEGISLDMSSIEAKLAETVAVSAILNNIFKDDVTVAAQEVQVKSVSEPETIAGLDSESFAFMRILATKLSWARVELEQLASESSLMLDGTLDSINDAAYDHFGGPFFDGDDPIEIDPAFAKEIAA